MKYQQPDVKDNSSHLLAEGEHLGFQWAVLHNGMGYRCGYIALPPEHPWHGKDYSGINAEVHGGLNYSQGNKEDGSHWIGFDCAHAWDAQDPDLPSHHQCSFRDGATRSQSYVERECKSLCEQANNAK